MSIYEEILIWSQGKNLFIQDALRRLITSSALTNNDIDELAQLVKKECGDTSISLNAIPLDNSHIPTCITANEEYPRLISLSNPINICALHEKGDLQFSNTGLNVVYGNNGSGKSSYSRILRKLCWSRNPSVMLRKNVFNPSTLPQQVDFRIEVKGTNVSFTWREGNPSNPALNSIFVFDNDCGYAYINNENPMEYKPIGIDILEKLIITLQDISKSFDLAIAPYNTQKPTIPPSLIQTSIAQWYDTIENIDRTTIDTQIQFCQLDMLRKQELNNLLSLQNPQKNITFLNNQQIRINNYIQQLKPIEELFTVQKVEEAIENYNNFDSINQAYKIATAELQNANTLAGFGTNPWRTLWEAAKNYAHSSHLTDGHTFPSSISLEKCVLCQQSLDETAKQRMATFSGFILNDISIQLNSINSVIQKKISIYSTLVIPPYETFVELEEYIPNFKENYTQFFSSIEKSKNSIIEFLQQGGNLDINIQPMTPTIIDILSKINLEIEKNNLLLSHRNTLINELNENNAKEFLFNNKSIILQYFDEFKYKKFINQCKTRLSTTGISRKIGELMEIQAVNLQHQEFISHLNYFNSDLASRIQISKTRTSQGNTYQKCSISEITDPISSIMSEGEQKIISLSNFIAECTIDNRLNTIIFDDPVTSLDMDYRDLIAQKIVHLSQNRQVIVFTHDLSFLRLLIDTHKTIINSDCKIISIDKYNGISGIITDEIPYLAKNVQERIDSIKRILREHDSLNLNDSHGRETKLDSARKRFRILLERSVEEILSNKTYERFSKNVHLKKGNLTSYIVTEQSDVDFLLNLFSKYSVTEHDGGISTLSQLPSKNTIEQDIRDYSNWKDSFKQKLSAFQKTYN